LDLAGGGDIGIGVGSAGFGDFGRGGDDLRSDLLLCINSDLDLARGGGSIGVRLAGVGGAASGDIGRSGDPRSDLLLCTDSDLADLKASGLDSNWDLRFALLPCLDSTLDMRLADVGVSGDIGKSGDPRSDLLLCTDSGLELV
jgi:hypothetical protein